LLNYSTSQLHACCCMAPQRSCTARGIQELGCLLLCTMLFARLLQPTPLLLLASSVLMYFVTLTTVLLPYWHLREGVPAAPEFAVEVARLPQTFVKDVQCLLYHPHVLSSASAGRSCKLGQNPKRLPKSYT
jgi:hypothetical protein